MLCVVIADGIWLDRPHTKYPDMLICSEPTCNNVGSQLRVVEERILQSLKEWLGEYKISWDITSPPVERISQVSIKKKALQKEQHELDTLNKQISKIHDLLEQGIYTTDVFLERSRALSLRMDEVKEHIAILDKELKTEITREDSAVNIIPKVEKLLEVYHDLPSPKAKNDMLKDVLEKVVYTKKERSKKGNLDNFNITIYPKIPKYIT